MRASNTPLVGEGPTTALAAALRKVRGEAGLSFQHMAAKVNCSNKSLCEATLGKALPSWRVTQEFLKACDVDPSDIETRWKPMWRAASEVTEQLKAPGRRDIAEPENVTDALLRIMRHRGVTVEDLVTRADTIDVPDMGRRCGWYRPSPAILRAVLATRDAPPDRAVLILVLAACGAVHADINSWLTHPAVKRLLNDATRLPATPADPPAAPRSATPPADPIIAPAPTAPRPGTVDGPDPTAQPTPQPGTPRPVAAAALPAPSGAARGALHRYGRLLTVAGVSAIVACAAALPPPFTPGRGDPRATVRRSAPRRTPTVPPTTSLVAATPPGRPARSALAQLAARTARSSAPTAAGPVTYVHTRTERPDDNSAADEPFTTTDVQLWWQPHRPGRLISTPVPADGAPDPSAPASISAVAPRSLDLPIEEPSDDPGILARQLDEAGSAVDTPVHTLQSIIRIYRYYCPNPRQRAAMLRLLADTTGLLATAGSEAASAETPLRITATADGNTVQQHASFDPRTGTLLHAEALSVPPAADTFRTPTMTEGVTFLSCRHQKVIG